MTALGGCAGGSREAAAPSVSPASPHVELEGVRLSEGSGATKVWDLAAAHVEYRTPTHEADLRDVQARFYQGGKLVSSAKAPRAHLESDARRFELAGGMRVVSPDGSTGFESQRTAWQPRPGRLEAGGRVRFWRPGGRLEAGAIDADRSLQTVHLTGGVRGRLALVRTDQLPGPQVPARSR